MKALKEFYRLKDGYNVPTRSLGAEVKQWFFPEDVTKPNWALLSVQYMELHLLD